MEPTKCNHTYTLKSGKVFRCDADPHPGKPSAHYFVRDKSLETTQARRQRGSHLIVIPGERT